MDSSSFVHSGIPSPLWSFGSEAAFETMAAEISFFFASDQEHQLIFFSARKSSHLWE